MSDGAFVAIYLAFAALPTLVGWRRGASAGACYAAILLGVVFGWTIIGWLLAWVIVLSKPQEPLVRITTVIITDIRNEPVVRHFKQHRSSSSPSAP